MKTLYVYLYISFSSYWEGQFSAYESPEDEVQVENKLVSNSWQRSVVGLAQRFQEHITAKYPRTAVKTFIE